MSSRTKKAGEERLIKKYPNRRLYDTQTSAYVTLSDIKELVMAAEAFKVVDAKTDEDLTHSILLQIILEEEACGVPVFSTQMLQQVIRFYGHSMQGLMGNHLERTMQSFMDMHQKLNDQSKMMSGGGTEAWTQMMNLQNPFMQNLIFGQPLTHQRGGSDIATLANLARQFGAHLGFGSGGGNQHAIA